MTILSDLHVHHPLSKVKQPKHSKEGRITNILHFRWLAAMVIKKCFQDYEGILSKSFTLGFSEIFIHLERQKHYYMLQYHHLIFYNDKEKIYIYKMIHAHKDLQKQNLNAFLRYLGVEKTNSLRIWNLVVKTFKRNSENDAWGCLFFTNKTAWSMMVAQTVCHLFYATVMNILRRVCRRLEILNRKIDTKNKKATKHNERLWRKTRHLGGDGEKGMRLFSLSRFFFVFL